MTETPMTEQAATTTEGVPESTTPAASVTPAKADTLLTGDQQPATESQTPEVAPEVAEVKVKVEGAPDKYEFKPGEGVTFDDKVIEQYSEVARELNLTQEAAQKMLDKVAPVMQARQLAQFEAVKVQWSESVKADKELGGERFGENMATAKKALEAFGTPELRSLLNESGLGNHPELIRVFYKAGRAISEDSFVNSSNGAGSAPTQKTHADSLYPSQKK